MNITHIIQPAGFGGIEVMLRDIIAFQKKSNKLSISLFMIVPQIDSNIYKKYFNLDKITICDCKYTEKQLYKLWNEHLKEYGKPDIIHSHHHRDTQFFEVIKPTCKKIATLHWSYLNNRQYGFFDAIIGNSEWQRYNIPTSYSGDVFILQNFYTKLQEPNKTDIEKIRNKTNCSENTFIFGAVGRLTYQKGFDTLIKAFLKANINNTRLIIVGDSNNEIEKQNIIDTAKGDERIFFPGYYSDPSQFFHSFDAFILSSRFESFGLVLTEAMSVGLPCISSNTYGPSDIATGNDIELFDIDNEEELAQKMYNVFNKGKRKIHYDLSKYDYSKYNKDLIDIYQNVIMSNIEIHNSKYFSYNEELRIKLHSTPEKYFSDSKLPMLRFFGNLFMKKYFRKTFGKILIKIVDKFI